MVPQRRPKRGRTTATRDSQYIMSLLNGTSVDGAVPMSKLEQLARKRAQQRNNTQQESGGSSSMPQLETKKVSLKERLEALKQNKSINQATPSTKSSSLLQSLKNKRNDGENNNNNNTARVSLADRLHKSTASTIASKPESMSANVSLRSKLDVLRKKQPQQNRQPISSKSIESQSSEENEESTVSSAATTQPDIKVILNWKNFNEIKQKYARPNSLAVIEASDSSSAGFIDFINRTVPNNKFDKLLKRRRDDIFGIYQSSQISKRKRMIERFSQPSPDDIIIEAQAKVFDEVSNNVANLKITEKDKESQLHSKPKVLMDVAKYLITKPAHLNISFLGHNYSGKSTLMGRILMDLKQIDIEEIRKLKNICERAKIENQNTYLTWLSDTTDSERSTGYSEQIHKSTIKINSTDELSFFVNPSQQQTTSDLISQISNTDVVVMVIDCSPDGFEQGFNLNGQTIEHSVLAKLCNVKRVIMVLNKMDTIDWYQGRYNEIVNELQIFYEKIGFKSECLSWIPVSSVTGEGLVLPHSSIEWFSGPSLLELLNQSLQTVTNQKQKFHSDEFFSLSIKDIKRETNEITGWITNGNIQAGESISVYPLSQSFFVDEVKNDTDSKSIGTRGSFVTLKLLSSLYKLEKNLLENVEVGDFATSTISPVTILNSKTIKLEVPVSLVKLTVGMKMIINRQMYTNTVKILKLHKGSKKNKTTIIECELIREDTLPYFSQGNQKENYMILRASGTNRTIGLGKLME